MHSAASTELNGHLCHNKPKWCLLSPESTRQPMCVLLEPVDIAILSLTRQLAWRLLCAWICTQLKHSRLSPYVQHLLGLYNARRRALSSAAWWLVALHCVRPTAWRQVVHLALSRLTLGLVQGHACHKAQRRYDASSPTKMLRICSRRRKQSMYYQQAASSSAFLEHVPAQSGNTTICLGM